MKRFSESIYDGGEQVVVLRDSFFTHAGAEGQIHNRAGEVFTVNHDDNPTTVWLINRNGKCSTEERDNLRLLHPHEPGYLATKEQWHRYLRADIKRLEESRDEWRVMFFIMAMMLAWVIGAVFTFN